MRRLSYVKRCCPSLSPTLRPWTTLRGFATRKVSYVEERWSPMLE